MHLCETLSLVADHDGYNERCDHIFSPNVPHDEDITIHEKYLDFVRDAVVEKIQKRNGGT